MKRSRAVKEGRRTRNEMEQGSKGREKDERRKDKNKERKNNQNKVILKN